MITSKKKQKQDNPQAAGSLQEAFSQYWTRNFSEQPPPETEIVVVGDAAGELPVHDRWWLTSGSGIRMGTSFNQIGITKDSEISRLTQEEFTARLEETLNLLTRQRPASSGTRLHYETFWL